MTHSLPPLRLTGAHTLRDGQISQRTVAIASGRISSGPYPAIDLEGYLIMPGIVDLGAERIARHHAHTTPHQALEASARELAALGVTTGCLIQDWGWQGDNSTPELAEATAHSLAALRTNFDLRLHLRLETSWLGAPGAIERLAEAGAIGVVSFTRQLGRWLACAETDPAIFAHWARDCGTEPAEMLDRLRRARDRAQETPRRLCAIAERFDNTGVIYGSASDPDGESREMYSIIGAKLCFDPEVHAAAAVAKAVGDPTVLSAKWFCDHASEHTRMDSRLTGARLLERGKCQAICSGDYTPSLAQLAFDISDRGICSLPDAWDLISARPAALLRRPDRGHIAQGKRADLTIINQSTRQIEATISKGRITYMSGDAAARFVALSEPFGIAAE